MSPSLLPRKKAVLRAQVIKSLAHPSRIQMVAALESGEMCVCELAEVVGADMSTVSKHLVLLKASGLVTVEKRGLNQYYRLKCPCLAAFFQCVDDINQKNSLALREACAL
ncbi:MAG: metalloregulator ArsR/SmtB family transcription factor [Verrucomicrobiae bacterium]